MKPFREKLRMGGILINQGIITEEQLKQVLDQQRKTKQRLGDILIDNNITTEEEIARALQLQLGIDFVDLRGVRVDPELMTMVPGSLLRKYNVVPYMLDESDKTVLLLAMADPLDTVAQDDIAIITNLRVEPVIATGGAINALLDRYFGNEEAMSAAEQYSREREQMQKIAEEAAKQADDEVNNAPIVQLVKSMIEQAARQRASDIHIEPMEKQIRVRYRIDGVLFEKMTYDIALLPAIVTRVKIISGLDISEKRKPQDGRITSMVDRSEYDIRVSVLPTAYGEKVVMRLASNAVFNKKKTELGMRQWELERFDHIIANPNGILLVTGPTGSGKSTTLYTALSELNNESVNIITVEDPIEANIAGVNQVQVNVKAELTFASALRSILRQDPDIIMIGEIRDYETASIAVQASITGHLVVSTLHTNSSAATITRLIDMGVEPFLIADSVVGVIAQRLVRRLCPKCRRARQATAEEKSQLGVDEAAPLEIFEPVGCVHCADSGFYGRIGVYEIMKIDQQLRQAIARRDSSESIKEIALKNGMHTLKMSAAEYVIEGITSFSEMLKVSFDD